MADELDDSFFAEEPSDIDETENIFDDEIDELDEIVIESREEGGSSRPFLLSLLGLLGLGVGAFLCLAIFQWFGFGGSTQPEVTDDMLTVTAQVVAIVQTNEAVATQNVFVTQTIEAREATATANAVLPTNTPDATETPVPTSSPPPAASSGGSSGDDTNADAGSGTGDTDNSSGNNADGGTGTGANTGSGSNDGTDTSAGGNSDSGNTNADNGSGGTSGTADDQTALPEQLPNTGFSVGGTLALAFGLLILLFGARRLRTI